MVVLNDTICLFVKFTTVHYDTLFFPMDFVERQTIWAHETFTIFLHCDFI